MKMLTHHQSLAITVLRWKVFSQYRAAEVLLSDEETQFMCDSVGVALARTQTHIYT